MDGQEKKQTDIKKKPVFAYRNFSNALKKWSELLNRDM
jgi:hypothetical protein